MGSSLGRTIGAAIGVVIVMLFFAVISARMTHTSSSSTPTTVSRR
jgi:hypothetical protein